MNMKINRQKIREKEGEEEKDLYIYSLLDLLLNFPSDYTYIIYTLHINYTYMIYSCVILNLSNCMTDYLTSHEELISGSHSKGLLFKNQSMRYEFKFFSLNFRDKNILNSPEFKIFSSLNNIGYLCTCPPQVTPIQYMKPKAQPFYQRLKNR